jgi:hypothetical protein
MLEAEDLRKVLLALWSAHPESGAAAIWRVDIRKGYGDAIYVTLFAKDPYGDLGPTLRDLKASVDESLDPIRHVVRIERAM